MSVNAIDVDHFSTAFFYCYALYDVLGRVSKPAASVTTVITGWGINICLILKLFDLLLTEGYDIL